MMNTYASLFTGFGGSDIGAMQAGLKPIWGVEYDPDIAGIAKANGIEAVVADMRSVDYGTLPVPDWLHASFVCERFSIANPKSGETHEDMSTAQTFVDSVLPLRPPFISIENVRAYEHSESFKMILNALRCAGYQTGPVTAWLMRAIQEVKTENSPSCRRTHHASRLLPPMGCTATR